MGINESNQVLTLETLVRNVEAVEKLFSEFVHARVNIVALNASIEVEAERVLESLRETADDEGYPKDLFVECVLEEIRRLMEDEHST